MGWNDWYRCGCNINEQLIEQTADAMVASGMRAAGYDYVNLDDCWAACSRSAPSSRPEPYSRSRQAGWLNVDPVPLEY